MARQIARMNKLVAEPGEDLGIEILYDPVEHAPHPRHARCVGMVGQPDIEREDRVDIQRHHLRSHHMHVGRRPADASAHDDGPQQRAGIVGGEFDELAQLHIGKQPGKQFLALGLVGKLHRKPVFVQILDRLGRAVDGDIGR